MILVLASPGNMALSSPEGAADVVSKNMEVEA
jgi:hypothetical protein